MLTEERAERLVELVAKRQLDFTIILENVHDPHNLGAIVRSCDAFGVCEVHIVYTAYGENSEIKYVGKRASRGASKWVDVHFHHTMEECMKIVRPKVKTIVATHLNVDSIDLLEMDLTGSMAIMFGNEKEGLSTEALAYADMNMKIPMLGMVQSINISNAVVVTLFEMSRQRTVSGLVNESIEEGDLVKKDLLEEYLKRAKPRIASKDPSHMAIWAEELVMEKKKWLRMAPKK